MVYPVISEANFTGLQNLSLRPIMDETFHKGHIKGQAKFMLRTENLKMVERISVAIYFVTSFFDDKEPLKWKLRVLVTNLVSYDLKDKSGIFKETASLFSIAKNAGLMSDMNHEILISELLRLENSEKKSLDIALPPPSTPHHYPKELIKDKSVSVKKNGRQETILSIIRRKKEVMIKDISPLISGYSEKTIQRELLSMVKDGILKKSGEKRWSRYSLA